MSLAKRMIALNIEVITITLDGDYVDVAYRFNDSDEVWSGREFAVGTATHMTLTDVDERLREAFK